MEIGGQIANGDYALSKAAFYGLAADDLASAARTRLGGTLRISGARWEIVLVMARDDRSEVERSSMQVTASGNQLRMSELCPDTGVETGLFTASPTELRMTDGDLVLTFSRRS
jgi:hypothetical protein